MRDYGAVNGEIKDAQSQLDGLHAKSEAAAEQFNAGRIELAKAARAAAAAQVRVEAATATMRAQQAHVATFAAAAYRTGGGPRALQIELDTITSDRDPQRW